MSQSLSMMYAHVVFSTKERARLLQNAELRASLHAYLAGVATSHQCQAILVGGTADHVHLLVCLGREITQAELVRELKRASSLWIKGQRGGVADFAWQSGYGIFSVSASNVEKVKDYIANQERHHAERSFQDEYRILLTKHGIAFDERYVWD